LALYHDGFPWSQQRPPLQSAIAQSAWAMTVTTAIPVVNAKAKAKTTAIFFMIGPLFILDLARTGRSNR
jgi:hypothetical protein